MRRVLVLAGLAALAGGSSEPAADALQAPPALPEAVRIRVPFQEFVSQFDFSARVRVRVVDGRVTDAEFAGLAGDMPATDRVADIVGVSSRQYVLDWRFAPGASGSFVTLLTHRLDRTGPRCLDRDMNVVVNAIVPTSIDVLSQRDNRCEDIAMMTMLGRPMAVPRIEGIVRCDCAGVDTLAGAEVSLYRDGQSEPLREVRTDRRGYFRIGGVPTGRYVVQVSANRHSGREIPVTISPNARAQLMQVRLERRRSFPPAVTADAWVRSAELPAYPREARARGDEGAVHLRLSSGGDRTVNDVDVETTVPALGRAAAANVRTWDVAMNVPVLTVTYTYRLLAGDCGPDQQPRVTMRFPHTVDVTAKRLIACTPQS
jgi:hypothetical protein